MVDALGEIFAKHEIPLGLMNKLLMLSDYQKLEFIIDDSVSMNSISDTKDKYSNRQSRWEEVRGRLKELVEILAYVPTNEVSVVFFNRSNKVNLTRNGSETPTQFVNRAYIEIDQAFDAEKPKYRTPALKTIKNSMKQNQGMSVCRYFFCDGLPDGGNYEIQQFENLIKQRSNPQQNPITFMSCSEVDSDVEWMKELEEVAPYAAEFDDYKSEREEVMGDQGVAFPFNHGFYLIGSLVAAINPDDLDAMDESVPFTKHTLDNLLGYQTQPDEYLHYFQEFENAQQRKPVEADSVMSQVKRNQNWRPHYNEFVQTAVAKQIPAVREFQARLQAASGNDGGVSQLSNQFSGLSGIGGSANTQASRYHSPNDPYQQQPTRNRNRFMGGFFGR